MARSFPMEEGGSATGVLITDNCQQPCGDKPSMRGPRSGSESFIDPYRRNFAKMAQAAQYLQPIGAEVVTTDFDGFAEWGGVGENRRSCCVGDGDAKPADDL
jgi:hypothetical protein